MQLTEGKSDEFSPQGDSANGTRHVLSWFENYLLYHEFAYAATVAFPALADRKNREFQRFLTRALAGRFLVSHPQLFVFPDSLNEQYRTSGTQYREKLLDRWIAEKQLELAEWQNQWTDYALLHLFAQVKAGRSLFLVCPVDWLTYPAKHFLKAFVTDHFHIRTVLTSWDEPWFFTDRVQKMLVILERKDETEKAAARTTRSTRFINLASTFDQLPAQDEGEFKKWLNTLLELHKEAKPQPPLHKIGDHIGFWNAEHYHLCRVSEAWLAKHASGWSVYLRAPVIYFEIYERCRYMLTTLKNTTSFQEGFRSERTDFHLVVPGKESKNTVTVHNRSGWKGKIENKYLRRIVTKQEEVENLPRQETIATEMLLFSCNRTREELEKAGDQHTLAYLSESARQLSPPADGEEQQPALPANWYFVPAASLVVADMIAVNRVEDRFLIVDNDPKVLHAAPLTGLSPKKASLKWFLRSSLFAFFLESEADLRFQQGLRLSAAHLAEVTVAKPDLIDESVREIYTSLKKRALLPITEELAQPDTQRLDTALLEAIGLDGQAFLPRIAAALTQLVERRMQISRSRKRGSKAVGEEFTRLALQAVIDSKVRHFPDNFYPSGAQKIQASEQVYENIHLPVSYNGFMGRFEVKDSRGQVLFETESKAKADYALLLSSLGINRFGIPAEAKTAHDMVSAYLKYVVQTRQKLMLFLQNRLYNQFLAEKIVAVVLKEAGISEQAIKVLT